MLLRYRISVASSAILLVFSLFILLSTIFASHLYFRDYVSREDKRIAEAIANELEREYRRNNSLQDVIAYVEDTESQFDEGTLWTPNNDRNDRRSGRGHHSKGMHHSQRKEDVWSDAFRSLLLITDSENKLIYSSEPVDFNSHQMKNRGVRIKDLPSQGRRNPRKIIGYVYVGSLYDKELSPAANNFLSRVILMQLILTLSFLALVFILLPVLMRHLFKPLTLLKNRAEKIEHGDYLTALPIDSDDEVGQLTRAFNQMSLSLLNQEKSREQLMSDIAHELRTPLTLLKGGIEVMLEDAENSDKADLEALAIEVATLENLSYKIRVVKPHMARVVDNETFSLLTLLEQIKHSYAKECVQNNKKILIFEQTKYVDVSGDKIDLKRLFVNLIENAFRYGDTVEIRLKKGKQENLCIEIEDNGIGIKPEFSESIFSRFFRIDEARSRETGGQGLGLSIVRKIALEQGGSIYCKECETGALFVLTLPLAKKTKKNPS